MNFKIFVINLDSSTERLANMKAQCEQLNLQFERVSAVRGSELSQQKKEQCYSLAENKKQYYKVLSDAEIGCSLSHISCWQKMVDDNLDFALILEDDAILEKSIIEYIDAIKTFSIDSWDYIKLSHGSKIKPIQQSMSLDNGLTLNTCLKLPSTSTGQFISFNGAQKLLKHAFPICRPIDTDLQYWYEKDIVPLVAIPFPVLNGDFGSEINTISSDRRNVDKNAFVKVITTITHKINLFRYKHKLSLPHQ